MSIRYPHTNKKTMVTSIYITPMERHWLISRAKSNGVSVSELIRRSLIKNLYPTKLKEELKK